MNCKYSYEIFKNECKELVNILPELEYVHSFKLNNVPDHGYLVFRKKLKICNRSTNSNKTQLAHDGIKLQEASNTFYADKSKHFSQQDLAVVPTVGETIDNGQGLLEDKRENIITIDFHVVYNESYNVPQLFFSGYGEDGSLINLDTAWSLLLDPLNDVKSDWDGSDEKIDRQNITENELSHLKGNHVRNAKLLSILTQMEHPILFRPFFTLHPCQTENVICSAPNSRNYIVTFLSTLGPYVGINLPLEIGTNFS